MRVAGVWISGAELLWVHAGSHELEPLQCVSISTPTGERTGVVFVAPDQVAGPAPMAHGSVVGVLPREPDTREREGVPGADLPPLGSRHEDGTVVGVDAVERTFTVRSTDGAERLYRIGR